METNYVGKVLGGRYEMQEVLGVGGMAIVYRAYDNIDDRPVAVKILKEEFLANAEFRRRFKNESKAIALLSHSNIVKVYDVSYGERQQYIVMEYVDGITLKEYIEQNRTIPWKEAVHFLTQILRALQHAHDRGVVHRDIKPQNIMLLHNGNIKVTDFGIARLTRSETRTMAENAIGSVHYISPEQARGDATDGKTDIYSLGVVLYEMLTGELPFQSDSTVSVAIMQLQSEPRRLREVNSNIPQGLEQMTMRAMQKKPGERYQNAAEMLMDLEEFKRNPLMKFEYSYYVDKEPTKYIAPGPAKTRRAEPDPNADLELEALEKRSAIPILSGIAGGVVLLFGLVLALVVLLGGGGDRPSVDDFVKKTRIEIENTQYATKYTYEWIEEPNSNVAGGTVFKQDPPANKRVKLDADGTVHIKLYLPAEAALPVPDVAGMRLEDAKKLLNDASFVPQIKPKFDLDTPEGQVISTTPKANETLPAGSAVELLVAVHTDTASEPILVPDLMGWDIKTAKEMLKSVGLALDATVGEVDSHEAAGKIVEQTPAKDQEVKLGTKVQVKISTGKSPARQIEVTIPLPRRDADGTLKIYMNSELVREKQLRLNADYPMTFEGNTAGTRIEATLDGETIYKAEIDFSTTPAQLKNEEQLFSPPTLPDVKGLDETEARRVLEAAGYTNIVVQTVPRGLWDTQGTVASQSPSAGEAAATEAQVSLSIYE